ncbi:hypothetical protein [Paenibacillus sp. FSL R5-0914]|uniref:hypothetical protein n=1 Tax=Paenibacillus sp. FSL R5-0914 TaxID=2921665 RepID=UPI0030F71B69
MKRFLKSLLTLSTILAAGMLFWQNAYGEIVEADETKSQQVQTKEEIPELRTENTKTFKTDQSGVYVRKVFNEQTHYQGEDGQFYEIETDVTDENLFNSINDKEVSSSSSEKFKNLKNIKETFNKENKSQIQDIDGSYYALHVPFHAEFPKKIAAGYSISKGADVLSFIPQNVNPSKGKKDPNNPNTMLYENVWAFTHIKLTITPTGIKEDIVLLNAQAPNSFSFEVKGNLDKDMNSGELTVLPAWLEDSTGIKRTVNTAKRTVGSKTYLDLSWDDNGLVYPVTIDPSINSQKSRAYNTCSNDPNTLNIGLVVGYDQNTRKCMSFVQFSDFQLPKSAQVTNVDLTIHGYNSYNGSFPVTVRQLFAPITMQLNYNNPPIWLDSKSVTANVSYTPKYETYRWSNLKIDTAYFRTGLVQLGMYYTGNSSGMLYESAEGYGVTQLEITYIDTKSIYNYDLNGRLSSIRTKSGHLEYGTIYDKNGNTLKRQAPYYTLLENHDFHEGSAMWKLGPSMSISNEMSVDGNSSLKFSSATATTSQSMTQAYSISADSASSYTLTADIMDNTTSGKVYVTWKEYNYFYGQVASGSQLLSTVPGQWSKKSISFSTSTQTNWITVQIVADSGTYGTAFIDSVNITPGIINAGFNRGMDGWYKTDKTDSSITVDSYKVKEGSGSLRFSKNGSSINTGINMNKKIPVNPGESYNFSAWFYNDLTTTNGEIKILVREFPEQGPQIYDHWLVVTEQRNSGAWFSKNINFTTKSSTRYIGIQIFINNAAGSAYVDQMQLAPN